LATAVVTSAIFRTCPVKFEAIWFTESVRSFHTPPTPFTVAITSDGEISVNGESVDEDKLKQLAAAEAEKNPELQALIGADRDVSHGTVIKILDWIKSSGIKKFSLTTDGPTK
jgi:biopolymer transport protein ExbD